MSETREQRLRRLRIERLEAERAAAKGAATANTITGLAGQFGAGSQAGIANMAGFPVDAVAGAINGVGNLTGLWGPIENPVGGSASIASMMEPFNRNIPEPTTTMERGARRVGEEVGAATVGLPIAMTSPAVRAAPAASAAVEGASAVGSGVGAAVANEVAPGSAMAEIVGALGGGVPAGMLASRAANLSGSAANVRPGIEDQRMRASDAYGEVRADRRVLPQESVDDLAQTLNNRMASERINPRLHPGAANVLDAILDDTAGPQRIEDIENLRRITTRSMPMTAAPDDRRLAQIMKGEITDYLDNLDDPVADQLREGRDAYRRTSAAQSIEDANTKAVRRAASTGSGGNEINAMRQNLRRILDSDRLRRSFTADELKQMDAVVRGEAAMGQNLMRRISRFAPSSGGLAALLHLGGIAAAPGVAAPIIGLSEAAKMAGEGSTRRSIAKLLQSIAPDRVLAPRQGGVDEITRALLAARTAATASGSAQ
ncbi:MAG: hypothetical protein LPL29_12550 [Alphaproteobacteria bacterium]|nr:hypothetical protein [Alphaproteobacteria bacterium]MDX5416444.1 hypothetical protein [Alphaproteobacteria bacterium]